MLRKSHSVCSLVFLIATSAACHTEGRARRELEKDGYTDVVLTKNGNAFDFVAKNASGQHCTGQISVSGGSTTTTSGCADVCTSTESTKCFAMGLANVTTDPIKSTQYYVTGCEAGDIPSCTNAGVAYGKGTGVTEDEVKSFVYDKKGCDGGDAQGCLNVSIDYEEGLGTAKDDSAAFRAADTACTKNLPAGCSTTGRLLVIGKGTPPDVIQGTARLDKACTGGVLPACANLGMYLIEATHGVTRDTVRGQKLLEEVCAKNEFTACGNLGLYFLKKQLPDPTGTKMVANLMKGCDNGEGGACNTLGYATESGLGGIKADNEQALLQYEKGCVLKHALACRNAGLFYEKGGRGLTKDAAKAAKSYESGCKLGDDQSCTNRKRLQ